MARRHKWSRTHAPSAGWRGRLLRNCLARVKEEREASVSCARARRFAILAQEASQLRDVDQHPPELSTEEISMLIDELEAALEAERREDEQRAIREHQMFLAERDAEVRELVNFHSRFGEGPRPWDVLCPVCSVNMLHVQHGVVFCACGLRLDGGTYDNLTLDVVRERLGQVIEEHTRRDCPRNKSPTFSRRERFGFTFMHAHCDACELDCIVL